MRMDQVFVVKDLLLRTFNCSMAMIYVLNKIYQGTWTYIPHLPTAWPIVYHPVLKPEMRSNGSGVAGRDHESMVFGRKQEGHSINGLVYYSKIIICIHIISRF